MDFDDPGELTATERAVFVAWRFWRGDEFTTAEVAALTGMTHSGAYQQLCRLARILPLYLERESVNGCYQWRWKLMRHSVAGK